MIRRVLFAATITVGLVALPLSSSADTSRFKAIEQDGQYLWKPVTRTIAKGDKIVWTNPTDRTHTVTAYKGSWDKNSTIATGDKTAKTFKKAGTYKFRCMVQGHSALSDGKCQGMCGTVKVQ